MIHSNITEQDHSLNSKTIKFHSLNKTEEIAVSVALVIYTPGLL